MFANNKLLWNRKLKTEKRIRKRQKLEFGEEEDPKFTSRWWSLREKRVMQTDETFVCGNKELA